MLFHLSISPQREAHFQLKTVSVFHLENGLSFSPCFITVLNCVNYKCTHTICVTGKEHGSAVHTVDFCSQPGKVGLGDRFFSIKGGVNNLVSVHSYRQDKASRMCFPVGLTLFNGAKALRCCGLVNTPGHKGLHSEFHSFPGGCANGMRSTLTNNQGRSLPAGFFLGNLLC